VDGTERSGVHIVEGDLDASGLRFAVVVSRFNGFITERLLDGAIDTLLRHGARAQDVTVVRVPGAWEIPQAAARIVELGQHDAIVALGCLMRGDTIHFDLIAGEVAKGLMALGTRGTAVAFGVLTTDGLEQSVHRAGAKYGNKGGEAALAAIEQARLFRVLAGEPSRTAAMGTVVALSERPRRSRSAARPRTRPKHKPRTK
jgi:6,7-dimethyl-8-ribityllumazine synthase